MRRIGLGAIVAAGLATALLDVMLCLALLGEAMRAEGVGLLTWVATLVLAGCFLVAVAIVLLHCAADWSWCRPGWFFGLVYLLVVVVELSDRGGGHGSPTPMILVFAYLTTIPFQLAVWARRTATSPPRPPRALRPPRRPLRWPGPVRHGAVRLAAALAAEVRRRRGNPEQAEV